MLGRLDFSDDARSAGAPSRFSRLVPFLIFFLSLLARSAPLGRYITPDEPTWVYRSLQFRQALLAGDWSGTLVAGHPGVITTWLGALVMSLQMLLSPGAREAYAWLAKIAFLTPDNVEAYRQLAVFLDGGRVAVILTNSLGIAAIYLLVKKLWGGRAALLAGVFLALDPFLAGLSGLLHVDGLSATFVTLSLLTLAVAVRRRESELVLPRALVWPALAGLTAALAVLSKTPTLLLLPVSGLALLWPLIRDRGTPMRARLVTFLAHSVAWGAAFLATALILFPALWASTAAVLGTVGGSANRHLDEALRETFFRGKVAFVHGPSFYPVVLCWRLSPIGWLAVLPLGWMIATRRRETEPAARRDVFSILLLVVWIALFLVLITLAAKKFDRYILPVVPAVLVLAAVIWSRLAARRPSAAQAISLTAIAIQSLFWLAFAAWPLMAYNPLVGGPRTAVNVLPVGWGEAVSLAGGRLGDSAADDRAISPIAPALAPFFAGQTLVEGYDDPATADYLILTAGSLQIDAAGSARQTEGKDLVEVLRFGGLAQGWIYRNPSALSPDLPAPLSERIAFGDQVALTTLNRFVSDDTVGLALRWQRLPPMSRDARFTLRIVIRDRHGSVWASQETPLLNEVYFFPPDWIQDETDVVRYALELPPGMPPDTYEITLSLIDEATASQLPVRVGAGGTFQGVAFEAGIIDVPLPESIVSASRMQIPVTDGTTWLDGRLQLLGRGKIASEALAGSRLPVELFWHAPFGSLPGELQLAWSLRHLDDNVYYPITTSPLSRFDTGLWRLGESIHEQYQIELPPMLAPGRYELMLEPRSAEGQPVGQPAKLSEIRINNIDRLYALPDDIPVPLDVLWAPLRLAGMAPADLSAHPGTVAELTLYWVKRATHGDAYSVFVHVVNDGGEIVAQTDQWPGGLPTDILDEGQVVIDRLGLNLPADLPAGRYHVHLGLYAAETGLRLPVIDSSTDSAADYVTLPVELVIAVP
ncbi:MAG: glycosyltransferase family 39 protein [Candidatus Promineofilum sp.]|nr:glycosyltransferase family 39 protein [Promineifilum sp.]